MRSQSRFYCTLGILLVTVCASSGGGVSPSQVAPQSNIITPEQILRSGARTALEAVQMLGNPRSRLRTPPSPSNRRPAPVVYVDGFSVDRGLAGLAEIRSTVIREIRFLSAPEATTRFGTGHEAGAILVITVASKP